MYKYLIFFSLLLCHVCQASLVLWPLGSAMRMERDENRNLVPRIAQQYALGIAFNSWSMELARSQFESDSEEGNVRVLRNYEDMTLWLGHQVSLSEQVNFVGSGGLGLYQEKIKTIVGVISSTSKSDQKLLFGLGAELKWKPFDLGLLLSTGARVLMSEDFDPNPQPEFFIRTGWQF